MKTSKLISHLHNLIDNNPLPYYIEHFFQLSIEVFNRYPFLFNGSKGKPYEKFFLQSVNALLLYLRLANRRSQWFCVDKLEYTEINIKKGLNELLRNGFLRFFTPGVDDIGELYDVLTINEIKRLMGTDNFTGRKAELWALFCVDSNWQKKTLPQFVQLLHLDLFHKLRVIYFGNPYQDMSTFVVEELAHLKHVPVALSNKRVWETEIQFERYYDFLCWEEEMALLLEADEIEAYREQLIIKANEILNDSGDEWVLLNRTPKYRLLKKLLNYTSLENRYYRQDYPAFLTFLDQFEWPEDLRWDFYNFQIIAAKKSKDKQQVNQWLQRFQREVLISTYRDEALIDKTRAWLSGKRREWPAIPEERIYLPFSFNDGLRPYYKVAGRDYTVEDAVIKYLELENKQAIHSENFIPRFAGILLFLDEIFMPVTGQFQSQYQDGPLDYKSATFYRDRKEAIDKKIRFYQDSTNWITHTLLENYHQYKNFALPGLYLKNNDDKIIADFVNGIPASVWLQIAVRYILHPGMHGNGFPDITVIDKTKNEYSFIEVKSPGDKLSEAQRYWLSFLEKNKINCLVYKIEHLNTKTD